MAQQATTTLPPLRWYIVHAYSNFEKKVAEEIKKQAQQHGLTELFEEVLVPTEEVVEIRRGQKINAERKFFPGYVLVKARLTDEAYHLVKNTPKVTGFLGTGSKPMPVSQAEVDRILNQVKEGVEHPKPAVTFEVGDARVSVGDFMARRRTAGSAPRSTKARSAAWMIPARSTCRGCAARPTRVSRSAISCECAPV